MAAFMNEFEHLQVPLEEIISATNNFDHKSFIGGGGFGKVYKGALARYEGSTVAFKRLDRKYGQGDPEFWKEIRMLSRYSHENLISLLGFCNQGDEMILLYEYASLGSLEGHLSSAKLTWTQRLRVCLDAAKGLNYLHDPRETHQRLIHCDIKSANILLDDQWNAKVADFGLSKIGPANQQNSILVTNAFGTFGYCDPEFMKTYTLTKESDVYSFGVVLFEVLCGRLCLEKINGRLNILVSNWKKSYQEKKLEEIIFQDLILKMDQTSLETFSDIAFQCLNDSREQRPAMSLVVQRLKTALKCQEDYDLKWIKEFEEIVNSAASPLIFKSPQELKVLLSKGLFLNGGKTWFSLDDKEKNYKMISMAECLLPFDNGDDSSQFSSQSNSRFEVGCYSTRGKKFKSSVRTQFLSSMVTYRINLVFKFIDRKDVKIPGYLSLKYKIEGETKILVVYIADNKEDEWLIVKLHEFTNNGEIVDLKFSFEDHSYCNGLEIEGIEFQPMENVEEHHQVLELQYQEILKVAVLPVMYRPVEDVKVLFSKGVLLNGGKKWFSINDNGEHSEFISIAECFVREAGGNYDSTRDYNSRFPVHVLKSPHSRFPAGALKSSHSRFPAGVLESSLRFKTCPRPQFLSPHITYTVNLVFKFYPEYKNKNGHYIWLEYWLESGSSTVFKAYKREDNWWTAELFQFTSDGPTFSLYVTLFFYHPEVVVEGIEFQPLEKVGRQVSESNDDETYWEQMLPNNYQHIIKQSKHKLQWTTKKELYSIFSRGFLIDNNRSFSQRLFNTGHGYEQWFSLDKRGKTCLTLTLRRACPSSFKYTWQSLPESRFCTARRAILTLRMACTSSYKSYTWQSSPESRFGEVFVLDRGFKISILLENRPDILSLQTRYASYLVYKLRSRDQRGCTCLMKVSDVGSGEAWYIFLYSPQTPVIRPKVGENTHNPLARRPKIEGLSQQRSDGWMEVKFYEFQSRRPQGVISNLKLRNVIYGNNAERMMIQCIEIRQI